MHLNERSILTALVIFILAVTSIFGQAAIRPVAELFSEVDRFEAQRRNELISKGTKYTAAVREDILNERQSLAKKYSSEVEARTDLSGQDYYYLGRLYSVAENDRKTLESMNKALSAFDISATGDLIQSALGYVMILSSKMKQMDAAEAAFDRWTKGKPRILSQQSAYQNHIATGYFKSGNPDLAIKHAQSAFDLLKTLPAKTIQEKRDREQIYINLIEVLALSYKKNKNADQSLNVLAEARAESFALPSAGLYRKVMDFVQGSGFSEKKMMQKVDSFASAEPAPDIKVTEWLGRDPIALSELRGKVVLLDFWATWCVPCISTFPRLRDWYKKYGGNDFELIGVTSYEGQKEGKKLTQLQELDFLGTFKDKYKMPYPIAVASPSEASMKYGINAFPTTILLDRNGVVRYIGIGAGSEESENLESTLKKILKEDVRVGSTDSWATPKPPL